MGGRTMPACRELGGDARLGAQWNKAPSIYGMEGALRGLPHQPGQLPSPSGEESAPPGPDTRAIHQFPGSSHVP
jgi:hypothetical protein